MPNFPWQGNLQELKAIDPEDRTNRSILRLCYSHYTNVETAFRTAAADLQRNPRYVSNYLFVFFGEPPTQSVRESRAPNPQRPKSFPGEAFRDVSVSALWASMVQKPLRMRTVVEYGFNANFVLYTTSESGEIAITSPPIHEVMVLEKDLARKGERYKPLGTTLIKWALMSPATLPFLCISGVLIRCLMRSRSPPVFLTAELDPSVWCLTSFSLGTA